MDPAQSAPRLDQYFPLREQPRDPGRHRIHIPHPSLHIGKSFVFFFLLLLFLAVSTEAYMTVYRRAQFPGLSPKNRLGLVKALYRIPFLPKTPEQILLSAVEQNIRLTKYTPDFSFSGALHSNGISGGSLDLHIRGPIDYTDLNNVSFDMAASFSANFAGTTYQGSTLMRKNDETIYAKIESLSDSIIDAVISWSSLLGRTSPNDPKEEVRKREIQENVSLLLAHWIAYDTSGVASEARKQLNEITGKQTYTEAVQKQATNLLLQEYILPEVQQLPNETIEDTTVYHLRLEPSKQLLVTMMEKAFDAYASDSGRLLSSASVAQFPIVQLTPQPSIKPGKKTDREDMKKMFTILGESMEDVRMDMYLGTTDGLLRKSTSQMSINFSKLAQQYLAAAKEMSTGNLPYGFLLAPNVNDFASAKLSLVSTFSVRNLGQSFTVDTPKDATSPASFVAMMTDALKTKAEKAYEEQKNVWGDDFKRLNTLLLRYYSSHNSTYPLVLAQAANAYTQADDPIRQRSASYIYQRSTDGKKYLLYVDDQFPKRGYSSSDSTLYGITSESRYPRYLDKYDIDRLLATPTPTVTPRATPTRRPLPTVPSSIGAY